MSRKVWIYQSDRVLNDAEQAQLLELCRPFFNQWKAHGTPLQNEVKLVDGMFLQVLVDESAQEATGCSIDDSVAFLRSLESHGFSFLDRSKLAWKRGDQLQVDSVSGFIAKVKSGAIKPDDQVYDNTITDEAQLARWCVTVADSWAKRHIKKAVGV